MSREERFERLIDIVAGAKINNPVSINLAAQRVGLPAPEARRMWRDLCRRMGHQATAGDEYRILKGQVR